jgi:hypothetical protein
MAKKARVGDIVEIRTKKGFAYAQYTHKNQQYGYLLQVLPGFHHSPPIDFAPLANDDTTLLAFVPLQAALNRNIFEIVSNVKIPDRKVPFPLFRAAGGAADKVTGKLNTWWLWNGERSWIIGGLAPEQRKLPIEGVWNDTLLIERIESGWRPEDDPR